MTSPRRFTRWRSRPKTWAGIRDLPPVLRGVGEVALADRVSKAEAEHQAETARRRHAQHPPRHIAAPSCRSRCSTRKRSTTRSPRPASAATGT